MEQCSILYITGHSKPSSFVFHCEFTYELPSLKEGYVSFDEEERVRPQTRGYYLGKVAQVPWKSTGIQRAWVKETPRNAGMVGGSCGDGGGMQERRGNKKAAEKALKIHFLLHHPISPKAALLG